MLVDTLFMDQIKGKTFHGKKLLLLHHLQGFEKGALSQEEIQQLKGFDSFLVSSKFSKNFLLKEGFTKQIVVIEPALHFAPNQNDKKVNPFHILLVSNIIERKGILPFLISFHAVFSNQITERKIELSIIGDTEMEVDYLQKVNDFISGQAFLKELNPIKGLRTKDELVENYQKSNVFVSAASMETFGMALQEAIAFSVPIFALKAGYVSAHLDDQSSFGFSNMKKLVLALLELYQYPNKHQSILSAAQNRTKATNFPTWEEKAKYLKKFFTQL